MAEADPAATAAPEPAAPHLEAGADPAPAAAAAPEPAAAPEIPATPPSLLSSHESAPAEGAAPAEGEPKPAEEPKPEGGDQKATKEEPAADSSKEEATPEGADQAAATEPPAPEPIAYEPFKFPEGIEIDDKRLEGFRGIASEIGIPQEKAQALVDMYGTAVKEFQDNTLLEQHRVYNEMRKGWQTKTKADEEIGGSGFNTTINGIQRLVESAAGNEKDLSAFNRIIDVTGVGDNPDFIRIMHRIARKFAEPAPPPPNPKPAPNPITRDRRATLYDNPRSPGNG